MKEQQIPKGYKRTEVGVIPEEWGVKRLGEIAEIDPENLTADTPADYAFNYISLEQINEGRLLGYDEEVFKTAPSRARRVLRNGDVLLSTVRPNLMAHFFYCSQIPNAVCSTGFAVLRAKPNKAEPAYLYAQLFYYIVNMQIERIIAGSNYPAINRSDVKLIEIPCPPSVVEQRAIAEALSDVDGLLAALDKLIAKKRAIKKATMQQLLTGKTRLPGFSGKWVTKRLGDLLIYERPDRYIVHDTEYNTYGLMPVLTANKSFILGYTSEDFGICNDTPVIVFDDFTTESKYVDFSFKVKSSAIKLLRPRNEQVVLRYIFERIQLIRFPIGDHKRYYISEYQHLRLPIPDFNEQKTIIRVLSDMDAEIDALERRREKTRQVKQGMMQQILTGRVRLVKEHWRHTSKNVETKHAH